MRTANMKSAEIAKALSLILISTVIALLITACGSSGSSSSGGGGASLGKASVSGNVGRGVAFNQSKSFEGELLASVYALAIPAAQAAGVPGVVVRLTAPDGTTVETTTDAHGNFEFSELDPGNYVIEVSGARRNIELQENTTTTLMFNPDGSLREAEVKASGNTISGNVDDGVSEEDDEDSEDDVSEDKVTVCHNGHNISIAAPAVSAHEAHGDSIGECGEDDESSDDESSDDESSDDESSDDES